VCVCVSLFSSNSNTNINSNSTQRSHARFGIRGMHVQYDSRSRSHARGGNLTFDYLRRRDWVFVLLLLVESNVVIILMCCVVDLLFWILAVGVGYSTVQYQGKRKLQSRFVCYRTPEGCPLTLEKAQGKIREVG
jgi:hypothetical protein